MHTPEEQAWDRSDLFEEITIANAEDFRNDRLHSSITITVRHPDLPEGISSGTVYVPRSLPGVLEATKAAVSAIIRHMEARVPETGGSALASRRIWDPFSGATVAQSRVVRDREVER